MGEKLKIGLALGSGGARGLAHAGVLEALEEAGIRADLAVEPHLKADLVFEDPNLSHLVIFEFRVIGSDQGSYAGNGRGGHACSVKLSVLFTRHC